MTGAGPHTSEWIIIIKNIKRNLTFLITDRRKKKVRQCLDSWQVSHWKYIWSEELKKVGIKERSIGGDECPSRACQRDTRIYWIWRAVVISTSTQTEAKWPINRFLVFNSIATGRPTALAMVNYLVLADISAPDRGIWSIPGRGSSSGFRVKIWRPLGESHQFSWPSNNHGPPFQILTSNHIIFVWETNRNKTSQKRWFIPVTFRVKELFCRNLDFFLFYRSGISSSTIPVAFPFHIILPLPPLSPSLVSCLTPFASHRL